MENALLIDFRNSLDTSASSVDIVELHLGYAETATKLSEDLSFSHRVHFLFIRELIDRGIIITQRIFREFDSAQIVSDDDYHKIYISLLHNGADPNTRDFYGPGFFTATNGFSLIRYTAFVNAGICEEGIRQAIRWWHEIEHDRIEEDEYLDVENSFILTFLVESYIF